jgi:hypothetical protein
MISMPIDSDEVSSLSPEVQGTTVVDDENIPPSQLAAQVTTIEPTICGRREARKHRMIIQGIFLLLGVGILMPWNAFISATQYFESRLCTASNDSTSKFSNFESVFAIVFNLSSVVSIAVLILFQTYREKVSTVSNIPVSYPTTEDDNSFDRPEQVDDFLSNGSNSYSSNRIQNGINTMPPKKDEVDHSFWLVIVPLSIYVIVFFSQACMVLMVTIVSINLFKIFTIVSLILCGACAVFSQSGIVAMASIIQQHENGSTKYGGGGEGLAINPYLQVRPIYQWW